MGRKIYITEGQLKNLLRKKINENIGVEEIDYHGIYAYLIKLVHNNEMMVDSATWENDELLHIEFVFDGDDEGIVLHVYVGADVDYSYSHDRGNHWTPSSFEDDFDFKFDQITPDNIKIEVNTNGYQLLKIDDNTYNNIIGVVKDKSEETFKEYFDEDKYRDDYCYDDNPNDEYYSEKDWE